jgi:uncharacterized membrane protein
MHTATRPEIGVRALRAVALAGLLGLVVLNLAWELWLAPTGHGSWALVKVPPLLLCVAGFWRHRLYTFRWASLLVWLYVLEGVVRASTEHGASRSLAVAELALSLLLFAACALYIRRRLGAAPRAAP